MEQLPFNKDADDMPMPAGQRGAGRDSLLLTATFRLKGQSDAQVRVRNLSAGGMMAEYPGVVTIGAPVSVDLRGIGWVDGRIAWATDGRVGIAFDTQIDPLAARKPVGKGAQKPGPFKPIPSNRG
ncbi:PilZ domain-containing protein [Sphingomonas sp. CJ99]